MEIDRYVIWCDYECGLERELCPEGYWVHFEDHLSVVNELQHRIRQLEAELSFDIDDHK